VELGGIDVQHKVLGAREWRCSPKTLATMQDAINLRVDGGSAWHARADTVGGEAAKSRSVKQPTTVRGEAINDCLR
jgi:hypothetical protein